MTTPPELFMFMLACIVGSAVVLFGSSMLIRRASTEVAFIGACLGFFPMAGCGPMVLNSESEFAAKLLPWSPLLLVLPIIVYVQSRALKISLGTAIAGLIADVGLAFAWFGGLAFFEMIASGDGGPGFVQYTLWTVGAFIAVQLALPFAIAGAIPKRASLPPRVARPDEYPRP